MKNLSLEDLKAQVEEISAEQQLELKGGNIINDDIDGI